MGETVLRKRKIDGRTFYCVASYRDEYLAGICAKHCKSGGFRVRKIKVKIDNKKYKYTEFDIFVSPTPRTRSSPSPNPRVPVEIIGGLKSGGDTRTYPGKTLIWETVKLR